MRAAYVPLLVALVVSVAGTAALAWRGDTKTRAAASESTPFSEASPTTEAPPANEEVRIVGLSVSPELGTNVERGAPVSVRVTYVDGQTPADTRDIFVFVLSEGCGQGAGYPPIALAHDGRERTVVVTAPWEPYDDGAVAPWGVVTDVVAVPLGAIPGSGNRSIGDCPGNGSVPGR